MTLSREEIEQLLPFLANGTLEGSELAEVRQAVEADADLAVQLAGLQALRTTMQQDETGYSPGDIGLARLMRDLDMQERASRPAPRSMIWQIAATVLLAVVIGQAVLLPQRDDAGGGFELASGAQAVFTITIRPDATEADIRALLLTAGVEIVEGPSALGLYGLALVEGTTIQDARSILNAARDIIETLDSAPE